MSLKRTLVLSAVLVGWGLLGLSATRADDPTPAAVAAGIAAVKATGLDDTFDKVLPLLSEQIQNRLLQRRPDLRLEIPDAVNAVALKLIPRRRELDSAAGRIWAQAFTPEELQTITAFYNSPAGKKYQEFGPKALEDSGGEMRKWSQRISDEMYDQSIAELKAKGIEF
ncbi:MAG: DUF2059 domain-containing protein [Bauldia sp.]